MERHTILGSGAELANLLAKDLTAYTQQIRLVSRNPKAVNATDELVAADLTDAAQTDRAVAGSAVVYLVVGLPYKASIWQKTWPLVMQNVLAACQKHGARLVFFDNVYMYGKVAGWMTEETPFRPVSKKGEARAQVARMVLDAIQAGTVEALIARSADFYGPRVATSVAEVLVFSKLRAGKKAIWVLNDKVKHSQTLLADAARALALLGNTPSAFGQTWHLPTHRDALTGKEFIELAAVAYGVPPKYTVLSRTLMNIAGLFDPIVRESKEMAYQNEADYLFDSSKFEQAFFAPTPYAEGILSAAVR